MDQGMLKDDLARAERQVTASEQHIARQRQIVAERNQEGFDLGEARRLLQLFEQLLTLHIAERDRLRKELVFERLNGQLRRAVSGSVAGRKIA
jgi:hypothetical protein